MDTRTAAALCMTDLASLIEAGDFRRFGEAENLVADLAERFLLRQRGLALSQLDDDLGRLHYADRLEADGLLRAVRATIRRHQHIGVYQSRVTGLRKVRRVGYLANEGVKAWQKAGS